MATSITPYTSLLLVLISLATTNGRTATTNGRSAPVDEVCLQTLDPPLCIDALGGPTSRRRTLAGVAEIGFQTAGTGAIGFQNVFKALVSSPNTTPIVRDLSGQCGKLYDQIFPGLISSAHESARVGRWADVISPANQILGDIDSCEKLFGNNSPVHEESRKVRVAVQAIAIIAKTL